MVFNVFGGGEEEKEQTGQTSSSKKWESAIIKEKLS